LEISAVHHHATARRNHLSSAEKNLRQRAFLCSSKIGLAFPAENLFDFHSLIFLNDFIEIDENATQPAGQTPTDGTLANGHKAGEGDIL
jgi:hypothetical protein